MSYCINPICEHRQNPDNIDRCLNCGTELLIEKRFRLIRPLRSLDFRYKIEVFEIEENGHRKVMKVLKSSDSKAIELLERETLILQLFNHPGIPRVVDDYFVVAPNNSTEKLHCLVMQKFEGKNLEEWVKENGKISQVLALEWLVQLVKILDEVHRCGFFHRDIKPSNIILQPDRQLGLIDFGAVREITDTYLAKVSGGGGSDTGLGGRYEITVIHSACYSPLEQINGQAVPQSDFYALGRTLAYAVTGIPLIKLPSDPQTARLVWRNKAPQIEKPFADLIDELMAPAPGKRPQSTQVILQRLEALPFKLTLNRAIKSNPFRLGASILAILIAIGGYKVINFGLGNYYFNQASRYLNEPKKAKRYYELAIKYNPKDIDLYLNLAITCQQISDVECINDNYKKIFKLMPNDWVSHYNLGNFYDEVKKYDLAEQEYKLAIKYSNNKAMNAVSNLARLKNLQGKYSEAAALALEGLKNTQDSEWQAGLYKNLGWARLMQQNYKEADKYLQKSNELDPERVDAYCLLAQVKEILGELNYASSYWEICLQARADVAALPEIQKWREQVLKRLFKEN